MKVFLAMPYSQLCDEKYEIKTVYKIFFTKLTDELKKINCEYFLAHEREKWGKTYSSAEESTVIDFETIWICVNFLDTFFRTILFDRI